MRTFFAFDIETDNSQGHGLDPIQGDVTDIAMAWRNGEGNVVSHVASVQKPDIGYFVYELARHIEWINPHTVVTWNGTFFDLPFIKVNYDREYPSRCNQINHNIVPIKGPEPKHGLLPGAVTPCSPQGAYTMQWHYRQHVDVMWHYRHVAAQAGISWSLKPVARHMGIDMIELDSTRLHEYTEQERRDYAASDAVGTLILAEMAFTNLHADGVQC